MRAAGTQQLPAGMAATTASWRSLRLGEKRTGGGGGNAGCRYTAAPCRHGRNHGLLAFPAGEKKGGGVRVHCNVPSWCEVQPHRYYNVDTPHFPPGQVHTSNLTRSTILTWAGPHFPPGQVQEGLDEVPVHKAARLRSRLQRCVSVEMWKCGDVEEGGEYSVHKASGAACREGRGVKCMGGGAQLQLPEAEVQPSMK